MAEQWEGLLEGAAQELRGHLTLDRVTASRSGEEITVYFTADLCGAISRRCTYR